MYDVSFSKNIALYDLYDLQGDLCNSDECFFGNISKISKGTIKYHSAKEAEFNSILFGTWDEKIGSVVFSQQSKT